jgi:hypothetical protein
MIDSNTGMLTFEEPPAVIAPSLTRHSFLCSPLAEGAATYVENEPYHSWKLGRSFCPSNLNLFVVLFFHHERLTALELVDSDARFGTSWADHSVEKEMQRKAAHDAWLSRCLGFERRFSWGSVSSIYDERAG